MKYSRARRIFNAALSFEGAATLTEFPIPKSPKKYWWPIQATISNFLIALELYLKCLLIVEGKTFEKNHKLSEFFSSLEPSSRVGIAGALGFHDQKAFVAVVAEFDRALVEWRYIYEHDNKSINLDFVKRFCRSTKNYIVANHAKAIDEA